MTSGKLNPDYLEDSYQVRLGRKELIKFIGKDPTTMVLLYLDYRKPFHHELLIARIPARISLDNKWTHPLRQAGILIRLRALGNAWWNQPFEDKQRENLNTALRSVILNERIDIYAQARHLFDQILISPPSLTRVSITYYPRRIWPQEFDPKGHYLPRYDSRLKRDLATLDRELLDLSPWGSTIIPYGRAPYILPPRHQPELDLENNTSGLYNVRF